MTDIARHLNTIVQTLQQYTEGASTLTASDLAAIRDQLAQKLPPSYGIASGIIIDDEGHESQPIQYLIYDKPLAGNSYTAESKCFHIQHVLLIIEVANVYSNSAFQDVLQRVASVKALARKVRKRKASKQPLPAGQQRETIPTWRLPVALIYGNRLNLTGIQAKSSEFLHIGTAIKQVPVLLAPDYIHFTGQKLLYRNPLLDTPNIMQSDLGLSIPPTLRKPRGCYICKQKFMRAHPFYDKLCVRCGDFSFQKRVRHMDLSGKVALVTGARIRIGYETVLRLLRCGATVIATTRFPHDAARRYSAEPDFNEWQHRLKIYGIDFRHTASLEMFIQYISKTYPKLDILINNAAQTVRRPPAFYTHLMEFERTSLSQIPAPLRQLLTTDEPTPELSGSTALYPLSTLPQSSAELSQIALIPGDDRHDIELFPPGQYDAAGQQIDNRPENSWTLRLDEVSMPEMLEVHLVNAVAPALLASKLKPLMMRDTSQPRFIINVSASEGQFTQSKRGVHPHTNMAKAALNMLTRSAAPDYAESGIYMNSVDPGWVSDQIPHTDDVERAEADTLLPIDAVDGATRICDPIFSILQTGEPVYGKLFKDYIESDW